jgi:tRNA threonylcarbamoyladenosine biosynthesis protein TsaB
LRTLVIDSATGACSVALFEDAHCIASEFRVLGRGHAEELVPMIAALPDQGRAARIAVALGPGSFTGVRVGLAAARGLALAWNAGLVGYPTLHLVAAMARAQAGAVPLSVAMTGGHGEWFVRRFDADGHPASPLASLKPAIAITELDELVAGSEARAAVQLRGCGTAISMLPDARFFPLLPEPALTRELRPIYGREPDARLPLRTVQ